MEKELEVLREIKKDINVKDNLTFLIDLHDGLFHKIVNRFFVQDIHGLTRRDILDQKLIIFWQAAVDYDETKGAKFVTWLGNYTFFFLSKEYNKVKNYQYSFEIIDDKQESQEEFRKTEKEDLLKFVFEKLDEFEDKRILKVFELRYFKTPNHKLTTWSEIGKALDLTGQACINLHCKGLSHLKRKIKHEQQNLVQFTY